jgi:hypothetical protein
LAFQKVMIGEKVADRSSSGRLRRLRRQAEQAEAAERERGRMHAELGQAATSAVTHGKHAAPSDEQSPIKARLTPSPTR